MHVMVLKIVFRQDFVLCNVEKRTVDVTLMSSYHDYEQPKGLALNKGIGLERATE